MVQDLKTVVLVERFGYFPRCHVHEPGRAEIVGTDEDAEMPGRCPSSVRSTMQAWSLCGVIIVRKVLDQ
jgi:hypothetical protein